MIKFMDFVVVPCFKVCLSLDGRLIQVFINKCSTLDSKKLKNRRLKTGRKVAFLRLYFPIFDPIFIETIVTGRS